MPSVVDNPFAMLSFLAAPAVLTNAATLLALGTSNRLARAADRARALSSQLRAGKDAGGAARHFRDFNHAIQRARQLVRALRCFYFGAGGFAAATCVSLVGATGAHFGAHATVLVTQLLVLVTTAVGVGAIVKGTAILVGETSVAIRALDDEQSLVESWRAGKPSA